MALVYNFSDSNRTTVRRFDTESGVATFIPVDLGNADYHDLVIAAAPIGEPPVLDGSLEFKDRILSIINPDPFLGVSGTVAVSGSLNLVTNVPDLIVHDVTTVAADPLFTKNVLISIIYNTASGTFSVAAREKTTDAFADLLNEEINVKDLGEFFVVAGGSTLLPV